MTKPSNPVAPYARFLGEARENMIIKALRYAATFSDEFGTALTKEANSYADALENDTWLCDTAEARPDAPAVTDAISMADMIDAAACLWEAVLDIRAGSINDDNTLIMTAFREVGFATMRATVTGWADKVHYAWEAWTAEHGDLWAFDFEFVPAWVHLNVTFDALGAHLAPVRKLPPAPYQPERLDDKLHTLLIGQMGMDFETVGGGARILSHTFGNDWSISATCLDGGGLPTPENWHIGIYEPGNDGAPAWEWRSDFANGIKLNMQQAIGAAWAIAVDA